jgi:ribosome recycling factor
MEQDEIMMDAEERMEKAVNVLANALKGIRTGRANPGLVDSVRITNTAETDRKHQCPRAPADSHPSV